MMCPVLIVVLMVAGIIQPWVIIVLSLVVGITDALSMPSFQSIAPSIVEPEQLPSALALNSTQFNLSRILGPALAGILIASVGIIGCFIASAASYLPFILIALWILPRRSPAQNANDAFDYRHPFTDVRKIMRDKKLRMALLTVLTTSTLCGPLITFCPVLVKNGFSGDAAQFSMTIGAFGLGGLVGAIGLLAVDKQHDRRRLSTWFATANGLIVVLAAVTQWFWSLPALLVLAGLSMTVSNTSVNTVLLTGATAKLRGQTISLYMLAMLGGISIGGLLTGISVEALGVREALLINSVLAVVAQLTLGRVWKNASAHRS